MRAEAHGEPSGAMAADVRYALVVFALRWDRDLETTLRRCDGGPILLVAPFRSIPSCWEHRVELRYLRVNLTPVAEILAFRHVRADRVVDLTPVGREYESYRYVAAAAFVRGRSFAHGGVRPRWHGLVRGGMLKLWVRGALVALRVTCRALRLAAPVLGLLRRMRSGRSGCSGVFRRVLGAWRIGRSQRVGFVAMRWEMLGSFLRAYLRGEPLDPEEPIESPNRVLVINPDLIGDTLTSVPALRALRATHPQCHIEFVASPKGAIALAGCPYIDRLHVLDYPHPNNHHGSVSEGARARWRRVRAALSSEAYDAVVVGSHWPERSLVAAAAAAPVVFVPENPEFLGTRQRHVALRSEWIFDWACELMAPLGVSSEAGSLEMWMSKEEREEVDVWRRDHAGTPVVGIQTMAPYVTRHWPTAHFQSIMQGLASDRQVAFIVFDPQNDFWWGREGDANVYGMVYEWAGEASLREAMLSVAKCDLFVGNEGGLGHVAAGFGVPSVLVFTTIEPSTWRPATNACVRIAPCCKCAPCGLVYCERDMECHGRIVVADVLAAVVRELDAIAAR